MPAGTVLVRDGFEIGAEGRAPIPPPAPGYAVTMEQWIPAERF